MKKIVIALFAAVLIITFTSCDNAIESMLNNFYADPTIAPMRHTITEQEWLIARESVNYTFRTALQDDEQSSILYRKFAGSFSYQSVQNDGQTDDTYFVVIDNIVYQIRKEDTGFVARNAYSESVERKLGEQIDAISSPVDYSSLLYDEEAKVYRFGCTDKDGQPYNFTFYFENGKVQSVKLISNQLYGVITCHMYDFGTTIVELPEFKFAS